MNTSDPRDDASKWAQPSNTKKSHPLVRKWRIAKMLAHTLYGAILAITLLPLASANLRNAIVSHWSRTLLRRMNIHVTVTGQVPPQDTKGVMFLANHVSWADIHVLNSVHAVRFIAKSEIRSWPVFGWFAMKANTLFIDREKRHDAGRIVNTVSVSLTAGDCLCYFPEGTTTDGTHTLPFKGSITQAAINTQSTVWPFSIRYPDDAGGYNTEMAYFGDMSLMDSIGLVLAQHSPKVEIRFAAPIQPPHQDRRELTHLARTVITQQLGQT